MKRRIGGRGGGSDPAPRGVALVAAAAVVAAAGAVGAGVTGGSAGSSAGGAVQSAASRNITSRKNEGQRSAKEGKPEEAWRRLGTRQLRKQSRTAAQCRTNSFGQVRDFFIRTPCKALERAVFSLGDEHGNVVVVSVVWVRFRSGEQARGFKRLIDIHGTGDVEPLGAELLELREIRFSGHHYDSRLAGEAVVIAETEMASGELSDEALDAIAEVATALPRP